MSERDETEKLIERERVASEALTDSDLMEIVKGYRWKQRADPDDPHFALFEIRLPVGITPMPTAEYEGVAAMKRFDGWVRGFVEEAKPTRTRSARRRR